MAWKRAPGARTHIEVHELASGNQWLSVDGPGRAIHNWMRPHRDPLHALLRPFDHALTSGKPVVGHVQYQFLRLPDERFYRVGHAIAVRTSRQRSSSGLLPGTVMLFPGIGAGWPIGRDGMHGFCHHIGIRETTKHRIKVSTHFRPNAGPREAAEHRDSWARVSEDAGIFHVGQMMVKDRAVLDEAGIACLRLPDGARAARQKRGWLWPELTVREHPAIALDADRDLWSRPNYLWTGYFLAHQPPNQATGDELHRFFLHRLAQEREKDHYDHLSHIKYDSQFDGTVHSHMSAVDLSSVGHEATYRFLVTLSAIVPGTFGKRMGLCMFGAELTHMGPLLAG